MIAFINAVGSKVNDSCGCGALNPAKPAKHFRLRFGLTREGPGSDYLRRLNAMEKLIPVGFALLAAYAQAQVVPEIQWQRSFGGSTNDIIRVIRQTSDGGYILGGLSASGATGNKTNANFGTNDFWLVKTDANGDKLWERVFGGSG